MPLNVFMLPGDTIEIDDDIRIRWEPTPGKGRRARMMVSAKGHAVRLTKGDAREKNCRSLRRAWGTLRCGQPEELRVSEDKPLPATPAIFI